MPDNPHDICGPSSLERRILCPASYHMELPLWNQKTISTAASSLGTLKHAYARWYAITKFAALSGDGGESDCPKGLSTKDADEVEHCVNIFIANAKDYIDAPMQIYVEHPIDLTGLGIEKPGTVDIYAVGTNGKMAMADYKFGAQWVSYPEKNWQIKAYCLGLTDSEILSMVIQPSLPDGYSKAVITPEGLDQAKKAISQSISTAKAPASASNIVPGEKQCQYCMAKLSCQGRMTQVRNLWLDIVNGRCTDLSSTLVHATPQDRGKLYKMLLTATKMIAEVKKEFDACALENRFEVDGFSYGRGKGTRNWIEGAETQLKMVVTETLGKPADDLYKKEILSVAQFEKKFGKKKALRDAISGLYFVAEGNEQLKAVE